MIISSSAILLHNSDTQIWGSRLSVNGFGASAVHKCTAACCVKQQPFDVVGSFLSPILQHRMAAILQSGNSAFFAPLILRIRLWWSGLSRKIKGMQTQGERSYLTTFL